jgi:N-acyl-L-homoserine lactone synthetase
MTLKQVLADYQRGKRAREDAEAWEPRRFCWQTSEEDSYQLWEHLIGGYLARIEEKLKEHDVHS